MATFVYPPVTISTAGLATEVTLAALNSKVNNDYGASSGAVRTASQIGNSSGAASFGSGVVDAQTLRVVLPTDQPAVAVTGPLTDTQLRASAVPVSGPLTDAELRATDVDVIVTSSVLPTGAATSANQATEIASLASIDGKFNSLGQKTMAASAPVVIASDQSAIAVSGPLTDAQLRATVVPVSGPLTDTQLRATPVPVSGTVTTGGLTDAQLRATPVPVSGTVSTGGLTDAELRATAVPVSGPLTDTQLRATPVPVSGTVSTGGLTDAQLRATAVPVSAASLPLPTGAATEATLATVDTSLNNIEADIDALNVRLDGGLVPFSFDYQAITYVGATTDIDTVTYKTGGAGGTTVATLTMGYDGSNRLTSVTRT